MFNCAYHRKIWSDLLPKMLYNDVYFTLHITRQQDKEVSLDIINTFNIKRWHDCFLVQLKWYVSAWCKEKLELECFQDERWRTIMITSLSLYIYTKPTKGKVCIMKVEIEVWWTQVWADKVKMKENKKNDKLSIKKKKF